MPAVITDPCDACGICVEECPMGAIELESKAFVDGEICAECGSCIDICPRDAIRME